MLFSNLRAAPDGLPRGSPGAWGCPFRNAAFGRCDQGRPSSVMRFPSWMQCESHYAPTWENAQRAFLRPPQGRRRRTRGASDFSTVGDHNATTWGFTSCNADHEGDALQSREREKRRLTRENGEDALQKQGDRNAAPRSVYFALTGP